MDAIKAMDSNSSESRPLERIAYRIADIAKVCGVSRRLIEAERSAGRLPRPDLKIGRVPIWRVETIKAWPRAETARLTGLKDRRDNGGHGVAEIFKRHKKWAFRYYDEHGRRIFRMGCPDKRKTEEMATLAEA